MKSQIVCFLITLFVVMHLSAQSPIADFTIKTTSCLNEKIPTTNTSLNTTTYIWDFCVGDFKETPVITNNISSTTSYSAGLKIVESLGIYYGFAINNSKLYRYDFGSNLSIATPVVSDLGDLGVLTNAEGIDIIKEDSQWIGITGFGVSSNGGNLVRLVWSDLSFPPTVENIGNFGFVSGRLRDIQLLQQGGNNILVAPYYNGNQLVRINFGSSMLNTPIQPDDVFTSTSLTNVSLPVGMSILKKQGSWQVVLGSVLTKTLSVFDLGADILSVPVHVKSQAFTGFNNLSKVKAIREGGNYYGLVSTYNGTLHLIDLKSLNASDTFEEVIIAGMPIVSGIDFIKEGSRHYVFGIQYKLQRLIFESLCYGSTSFSIEESPIISYSQSGIYEVDLVANDALGYSDYITKNITISPDQAPSISFANIGVCANSSINFSPSSVQTIVSYSWDFGDTNTSTNPNPSHTYAAAGIYEVTLNVLSSNGCNNFTKQTIKIYDPPIPDFTLPTGLICTSEQYTFTNNTIDNFDGNLTYEWQVDGITVGTNQDLRYSFTTGGTKLIKLITSIPGCSIEQVQTITNVEVSATPAFTAQDDCVISPINFINQSTGGVSYEWDFGDGNTSIAQNVSHQYAIPGIYDVLLKVTNSVGCVTSTLNQVEVHAMPVAAFSQDLSCSESITTFLDESTIANTANIAEWNWTFEDGATYTVQHPEHVFATSGQYDVSLTVSTNAGCEASILHTITVLESPRADFTVQEKCIDDAFIFSDASIPNTGSAIVAYNWDIDGSPYSGNQASHIFSQAKTYQTKLTVESDNNCIDVATQTILVDPLPVASFTVTNTCVGSETVFIENSNTPNDEVVQWQWMIDGKEASSASIMYHSFQNVVVYEIQLNLTTQKGCDIISTLENVVIHDVPIADFELSQNYGETPLIIDFANHSTNANTYLWNFAGFANSIDINPNFTFSELGEHQISLTAVNEFGCDSTISKTVYVVNPVVDIELTNILEVVSGEYILTIKNNSNIPVNEVSIVINLGNEVKLKENINLNLLPGKSINHPLSFSIPSVNDLGYLCFALAVENVLYPEENITNNKICISIGDDVEIINVYPNPVKDFLNIPFVAMNGQEMMIQLIDLKGDIVINDIYQADNAGLNTLQLDLISLAQGVYILQIQLEDEKQTHRIFVE